MIIETQNLWNWSLISYDKPRVKPICLQLQDRFSQNVNVLLWACWLAQSRRIPTLRAIDMQQDICNSQHASIINGIRKARRELTQDHHKPNQSFAQILKKEFLTLELSLEKHIQTELERLPSHSVAHQSVSTENIARNNLDLIIATQTMPGLSYARLIDALVSHIFS